MHTILMLEGDWRQTHSVTRIYKALSQAPDCSVQLASHPLKTEDCLQHMTAFLRSPEGRSGPNVIILSGHGVLQENGDCPLLAHDGPLHMQQLITLSPLLKRTLLILDTCHLGEQVTELHQQLGTLALIGFKQRVNWTASSIFMLGLLRRFQAAGVFEMRRASAARPMHVFERFCQGDYQKLAVQLGVTGVFGTKKGAITAPLSSKCY